MATILGVAGASVAVEMATEPPIKKSRYSRDPDLEVFVEDEVFPLHSRDLMAASDVFCNMLENDMKEAQKGRIVLEDKSKREFQVLLKHICFSRAAVPPDIDKDNIDVLLRWADEYAIEGLMARCEKFLVSGVDQNGDQQDTMDKLNTAIQYNFADLKNKCIDALKRNMFQCRNELIRFVDNPKVMCQMLPSLFQSAGLPTPSDISADTLNIKDFWPLIVCALEFNEGWHSYEQSKFYASYHKMLKTAVFDSFPKARIGQPQPAGVALDDVTVSLSPRFPPEQVQRIIEALILNVVVSRNARGRYYRVWHADHVPDSI